MGKMKFAAIVASIFMAFSAGAAQAAVVYAPEQPISINMNAANPSFSQTFKFAVKGGESAVSAALVLLQTAATTTALKSLSANLLYQTSSGSWTSLWSSNQTFTLNQKVGTWATSFDNLTASVGNYKLNFNGSVFSNNSYSGSYQYQVSVAPVPEPETYALMGVGLVALLLRRKQKKTSASFELAA